MQLQLQVLISARANTHEAGCEYYSQCSSVVGQPVPWSGEQGNQKELETIGTVSRRIFRSDSLPELLVLFHADCYQTSTTVARGVRCYQ